MNQMQARTQKCVENELLSELLEDKLENIVGGYVRTNPNDDPVTGMSEKDKLVHSINRSHGGQWPMNPPLRD